MKRMRVLTTPGVVPPPALPRSHLPRNSAPTSPLPDPPGAPDSADDEAELFGDPFDHAASSER